MIKTVAPFCSLCVRRLPWLQMNVSNAADHFYRTATELPCQSCKIPERFMFVVSQILMEYELDGLELALLIRNCLIPLFETAGGWGLGEYAYIRPVKNNRVSRLRPTQKRRWNLFPPQIFLHNFINMPFLLSSQSGISGQKSARSSLCRTNIAKTFLTQLYKKLKLIYILGLPVCQLNSGYKRGGICSFSKADF
jgi:hypothetical protein